MDKDFVLYLNEENILTDLETAAGQYEKTVGNSLMPDNFPPPPFRFHLTLDLDKIKKLSGKLYRLFVKEPQAGLIFARNVIFCIVSLVIRNVSLEKTDLQLVPLVSNLPVSNQISRLLLSPSYGLETLQGMLICKTTVAKYVRSSILRCESKSCRLNKWQRYNTNNIFSVCPECHGPIQEHVPSMETGEEISCQFVSLKAYNSSGRFQALNVKIKDELCNDVDLQVGEEYVVTGTLSERIFEAMNVESVHLNPQHSSNVPESIADFYHEISRINQNCPWSFAIALSSLVGSHIIPTSSFLNLKIGLMLSTATLETTTPVHLLAVGSDALNARVLFQAVGKFADRYIRHSVANSFLGGIVKPGSQADVVCHEAGQLILAAKGICNLGDWSKLKREQANYICQTIESGQILFNKGEFGKPNVTSFAPLKCAVWTHWYNPEKNRTRSSQLKTLINVFGMPFLAEENNETEQAKLCWNNMCTAIKNHVDTSREHERISADDFRNFVKAINSREVTLTDAASQLIRSYFVVSRRDRPHCLPLGAIKTITSLAEAHARLSLRYEVLFEDVILIIYLYEETMSTICGESLIPYPRVPWNEDEPIYVWMSKQLRQFNARLEEYITL